MQMSAGFLGRSVGTLVWLLRLRENVGVVDGSLLPFTVAIGNICGGIVDCAGLHGRSTYYPMTTTIIGQISDVGDKSKNPCLQEIHPIFNSVVVAVDAQSKTSCQLPQPPSTLKIIAKTYACWKIANTKQVTSWAPENHRDTGQVVSMSLRCMELDMCHFP